MKKTISFVLPIYNEQENISLLLSELTKITNKLKLKYNHEIIFINDGSQDNSLELLSLASQKNKHFKIINFSRNFGHQIAITAGLDHASGDAVIIMDSDLQDPPSVCLDLIKEWEEGYKVVYARRRSRQDSFFKKLTASLFYQTINYVAELNIPPDTGDFRLLDKQVVLELNKLREQNRFVRGMVSFVGFKQTCVYFDRQARQHGQTHYPMLKMTKLAVNAITSFSTYPLDLITFKGFAIFFLNLIYALVILIIYYPNYDFNYLLPHILIWLIIFFGSGNLIAIGIIGSYLGRTYFQTLNRPLYIIENKINIG